MGLSIGQKAPDFTLTDTNREQVSLSQFNGQTVLILFFPGAYSGKCTEELCSLRDDMDWYNKVNAQVLGISTDTFFALN